MKNKLLYILLLLLMPVFLHFKTDNRIFISNNKMLVRVDAKRNTISIDSDQNIKIVTVILAEPLGKLDFRKQENIRLKIVIDGTEEINAPLKDYVKSRFSRKKTAYINQRFDNFTKLQISVYDEDARNNFVINFLLDVK